MSDTLIISCVGQIVVLLVIFIQQIILDRNINMQLKNERKREYYAEKKEAYKILIDKLNVDFFEGKDELRSRDLDFFYKDVFLYVSDDIVKEFFKLNRFYQEFIKRYENLNINEIECSCRYLGRLISNIRDLARKEYAQILN